MGKSSLEQCTPASFFFFYHQDSQEKIVIYKQKNTLVAKNYFSLFRYKKNKKLRLT